MNIAVHNFRKVSESRERLAQIIAMQAIEGNPLTIEEIEMFEMFDREQWSDDRQLTFIREKLSLPSADVSK